MNNYLHNKHKYIKLCGGFIKNTSEEIKCTGSTDLKKVECLKSIVNEKMPLCLFNNKSNVILINSENYILFKNITVDVPYEIWQLNETYDINLISPKNLVHDIIAIDDNVVIPGISNRVNSIYLLRAYNYHTKNIFRNKISTVWTNINFSGLRDIIYANVKGGIYYQNKINIVLSLLFINNFNFVFEYLDTYKPQSIIQHKAEKNRLIILGQKKYDLDLIERKKKEEEYKDTKLAYDAIILEYESKKSKVEKDINALKIFRIILERPFFGKNGDFRGYDYEHKDVQVDSDSWIDESYIRRITDTKRKTQVLDDLEKLKIACHDSQKIVKEFAEKKKSLGYELSTLSSLIKLQYNYVNFTGTADPKYKFINNLVSTNNIIDCIQHDELYIDHLDKIKSFDELYIFLNGLVNYLLEKKTDRSDIETHSTVQTFEIIMGIIDDVYAYVEKDLSIIERYNYSLYIHKLTALNVHNKTVYNDSSYKQLLGFVNKNNYNYIKNKLILNISCLIFLCIKINRYVGPHFYCAQYMLLDYFLGISKINKFCTPINSRQILMKILSIPDTPEFRSTYPTNDDEILFFENSKNMYFTQIKQYTFPNDGIEINGYADCGETALINLFNYLLIGDNGMFDLSDSDSWDEKLRNFYLKYPSMENMNEVDISVLKADLALVFTKRGDKFLYNVPQCDIIPSIENMTNICAILLNIPDPVDFFKICKKLKKTIIEENLFIEYLEDGMYEIYYKENIEDTDYDFVLRGEPGHAEFSLISKFKEVLSDSENLEKKICIL